MPLFDSTKQWSIFFGILFVIFCINIYIKFSEFKHFLSEPQPYITAVVNRVFISKNGMKFISIDSDGLRITTRISKAEKYKPGDIIGLEIYTINAGFLRYLSGKLYLDSTRRHKLNQAHLSQPSPIKRLSNSLASAISNQHSDKTIGELYKTLFLAIAPDKDIRQASSLNGSAHLLAISGYHLGVLSALLYAIFLPVYRFFSDKFFPWRDARVDVGVLVFGLLGAYFCILDDAPSFLRALVMALVAFLCLIRGIYIFSFKTLFVCAGLCVSLCPRLLFSTGFCLSLLGVWLIFVFFKHFKPKGYIKGALYLNLYLFFTMLPVIGFLFGSFSFQQIFGVGLSLVFGIFYPLALLLHLLGVGDLLDDVVRYALWLRVFAEHSVSISPLVFWCYIALVVIGAKSRAVGLVLPVIGASFWLGYLLLM